MRPDLNRRRLIQSGIILGGAAVLPRSLYAIPGGHSQPAPPIQDERLKELTSAAINAATDAGADYCDVRLTHTVAYQLWAFGVGPTNDLEQLSIGIRTLSGGYWGFASGSVWSREDAARLGRDAVSFAKANIDGESSEIALAPSGKDMTGHWETPVEQNPFLISRDEIFDYMYGLEQFTREYGKKHLKDYGPLFWKNFMVHFESQNKVFSSSDGHYLTQTNIWTEAEITLEIKRIAQRLRGVSKAGKGFEHLRNDTIRDRIVAQMEQLKEDSKLPFKPVDVGRYNVVFDAVTAAQLLSQTIGTATEADRVLGFEANAGGTSYIDLSESAPNQLQLGNSLLNVTADRTLAGGAATARWDDEGIETQRFPVIDQGMLKNLQTSRESAAIIVEVTGGGNSNSQSLGCAVAQDASHAPLNFSSNLVLETGSSTLSTDDLIREMDDGVFIETGKVETDFQKATGLVHGKAFEIRNGKKTAVMPIGGVLFRTTELWKSLEGTGGPSSVEALGLTTTKGQPGQNAVHTAVSPPILCKEMSVIDVMRKG